jgi:hypothetical protein
MSKRLAGESGAQGGLIDEKSRETVPLTFKINAIIKKPE